MFAQGRIPFPLIIYGISKQYLLFALAALISHGLMYIFFAQGEHGCNPLLPQMTSFSPLETFAHPSCRCPVHLPPPPGWGRPKCAGSRGGTHGGPHELVKGHEHPNICLISKREKRNTWKYPVIIQGSRDLSWTNTFVCFMLHICIRDRLHLLPKP